MSHGEGIYEPQYMEAIATWNGIMSHMERIISLPNPRHLRHWG